jgi:hypothetical protein
MKPSTSIVLLKGEEAILTLKRIQNLWSFTFHGSHISLIAEPREIIDFLTSKKPLKSEGKLYLWDSYPEEMKPDPEKLSEIVVSIMKEEIEKCKNDHDYFYKTYILTK